MTANLISTGVRLVPLGQTDGQRVFAALEDRATAITGASCGRALVTSAGATFRVDLGLRHETQYTRLFRS